ncbi:MAG: hypothetical protein DWH91_15545 [Planctomycetota bacterium]|nr:MAG: hypothetical protein DWH91_15545 [Planctomycetota bacterium]
MEVHYPTVDQPATPYYVLAVLQDMHRQQCQHDPEADPDMVLSLATTVADWRNACDLVGWEELGRAHNDLWGVCITDSEWKEILEPAHNKRLEEVCELVASRITRPVIRPVRLLGGNCLPAGAFLTIRSLLCQAGERFASEIAPSTPLAPYARRYASVFLGPVSRLAPGSLPLVRIRTPVYDTAVWGILLAIVSLFVGACTGFHSMVVIGLILYGTCYALTWYAARCLFPASVEFGELRTFRDLAVVVAEGKQA